MNLFISVIDRFIFVIQALKKRPKFKKLEDVSFLLRPGDSDHELRDYQLEGVNWMLHAWSK